MATLTPLQAASPLDSSNDVRLAFTDDLTETLSRALDDTDADFATMTTLSHRVEYRVSAAPGDDTYGLSIRIVNGATILAAADSGGTFVNINSNVTNTTDTTSSSTAFAYVNTTADKATWDGASVELRQTYSKTKGPDVVHIEVDFVDFTGTYVAGATNTNVPLDAGSFSATGQTLTINTDDAIAMDAGSFTITGYSGNTSYYIPPLTGAFTLTGYDATASTASNTNIPADLGTFSLSGFDATVSAAETVALDAGSFAVSGKTIAFRDNIVYVGRGTTLAAGSGTPTVSPSLPPTWAEGDIFYLIIQSTGHDTNPSPSPGAGWELVGSAASGTTGAVEETRVTVYWRRATASESAPTVGYTGDHALAVVTAWRGAIDTGTPHEATQTSTSDTLDTTFSVTGLTTLGGLRMILSIVTNGDDGFTSAETNSSLVSIISSVSEFSTTFNDGTLSYNWGIKKDAGAVGATTGTFSKSAEDANLMLAIRPNIFGDPPTNISIDAGTYTLSGLDAAVQLGLTSQLDAGSFTVTGYTATIDEGVSVPLGFGAFTLTGYSGNTSYYIPPLTGAFTLSGQTLSINLAGSTNVPLDLGTFSLTGNALGIGSGLGGLAGTLDQGPDPDELDWSTDTSVTGTLYWVFTASATPPALQGTPAGFADTGLANGNFAITAGAGTGTIDLSSVGTGDGFLHAVAYRTSDGAFTRVDSDAIAIPGELLPGTFTLTGYDLTASEGVFAPLDAGSFTITGYSGNTSYYIPPLTGSFTLSGQTLGISEGVFIPADLGTFTLSGFDVSALAASNIPLDAGAFTATGFDVAASTGAAVSLVLGTFTVAGFDLTALTSDLVSLDAGSFSLSGFDVTATTNEVVSLDAGAFTIAGQTLAVNTAGNTSIPLDAAAYALSGLGITSDLSLTLAAGSYSLTGLDSTVSTAGNEAVPLDLGTFSIAGFAAAALTADIVELDAGSYAISGLPAGVAANTNAPLASGSYGLSGFAISTENVIPLDSGAFSISGLDASVALGAPGDVFLAAGAYSLAGYDVAADFILSTLAVEPEYSRSSGRVVMGNLTGVLVRNTKTGKIANG